MEIDTKTKGRLIAGHSLTIDDKLELPPKYVSDILLVGEEEYSRIISLLSIEKERLLSDNNKLEKAKDITTFDIITNNCYYSIEFREEIIRYLSFFFNDNVGFLEKKLVFFIGDIEDNKILDNNNYEKFLYCMKIQNKIDNTKASRPKKKMSKKKERLMNKRSQGRKLLEKARGQDNITLSDLVLNLAVFLGGDFSNAINLTLYQFYELYQKFLRQERYEQNFEVYIAGGDPKKLDLDNHWTARSVEKTQEAPQSI